MAEDEVDVADFVAEGIVPSAEAKTREMLGLEVLGDGFEAVIGAGGTVLTVAIFAKNQLKIVAKDENISRVNLIKVGKSSDGQARIVVKSLGFDKNPVAIFEPEGVKLGLLPGEMLHRGVKIQRQKTVIMAGEVVFVPWVAEADDEFHKDIITYECCVG